jgi:nitrite reductase/ring-hydroxylating ferredoxin subunit
MTRRGRRVERWVDDLIHDRSPRRLRGADAEDAEALAAAIVLRSATPGWGMPDPHFVEQLHRRTAQETQGEVLPRARLSRRRLLATGGAAAAAAATGIVVGDRLRPSTTFDRNLVADGASWVDVAAVADIPVGTVRRFSTVAFEGFVVNRDGITIEALSASCTHLGCILRFNPDTASLDCPCHRATFALDGSPLVHMPYQQLPPLPRLQTRVRGGRIEVLTA